jgi:hypothetical protein
VRTTEAASWALEKYARDGQISADDVTRLARSLGNSGILPAQSAAAMTSCVRRMLDTMEIRVMS